MSSSLNSKGSGGKNCHAFSSPLGKEEEGKEGVGKKNPRHSFARERNLGQVETFAFIPNNGEM